MRLGDCGNPAIDRLAHRGQMMSVWNQLEHRYPEIAKRTWDVFAARRDGRIRRMIESDPRAENIRKPFGPESDTEWDTLAALVLEIVNRK